jgi:hypothetical protein
MAGWKAEKVVLRAAHCGDLAVNPVSGCKSNLVLIRTAGKT